jgi:hypothetical protein
MMRKSRFEKGNGSLPVGTTVHCRCEWTIHCRCEAWGFKSLMLQAATWPHGKPFLESLSLRSKEETLRFSDSEKASLFRFAKRRN